MMSDDKISEALDLVELVEFTIISAINEASSQQMVLAPGVGQSGPQNLPLGGPQNLPLGGMYRSLNTARKLLRDVLNNQRTDSKPTSTTHGNTPDDAQIDNPDTDLERETTDRPVNRAPRQGVIDPAAGRQAGFSKGAPKAEGGLASRIRPVPDEVRGRVRELVDMLEEEDLNSEQFKETRA